MVSEQRPLAAPDRERLHRRVSGVAWGLLFVWVGIALLAQVGWGLGLLGVGAIILGAQAARRYVVGLPFEGFYLAIGVLVALGGIWALFNLQVALVPVLFLLAGFALILSALVTRRAQ